MGKSSSMIRYCGASAFTNGAIRVFFAVTTGSMPSMPASASSAAICGEGKGVILSIMLQGNATVWPSAKYAEKPFST